MTPQQHLDRHRNAGRFFEAGGLNSFIREEGIGEPVVCMHGVPASSYLYRKVLPELAQRGFRGVAFDLPGLGLADRPDDFDYSWTGLGRWVSQAVDTLELDRFHFVIHDLGGPIGLEFVAAHPERIASLTILNTVILVEGFRKPWVMRPFERKTIGELYLATMTPYVFARLMRLQGVQNIRMLPADEAAVYVHILKTGDRGRAFLKIMRGFEPTAAKQDLYVKTIRDLSVPVQFIWGEYDPSLKIEKHGLPAADAVGVSRFHRLPAKHFLQEDQAPALAELVSAMAVGS